MFPKVNPKQSFPEMEANIVKFWKENDTFKKSVEQRPAENPYRFYDGPPFITGTPHYGSLLSSIIKDIVPRYHTMQGKRCERVWGWDCHGLPIEEKVQKKLGLNSNREIEEKVGIKTFIEECYKYTKETSAEWDWYIDHIGRWVDTENAYRTMDQDYMESVMWVFKSMWDKDMIYKGQRVSLYSWKLSTPISNFEVAMDDSYEEVSDPAITVMFPLTESTEHVKEGDFIIAWTTTPWTIPAHMSMALNPELAYSRVSSEGKYYILATARVETVFKGKEYEIVESFMGSDLIGLRYEAPFHFYQGKVDADKNHRILPADFITDTDGTGIGHQAPEFGDVDFQLAKEHGVHISSALDNEGKYTDEIPDYEGMHYQEANEVIPEKLKEMGKLFKKESINHRVAMCPRSGTPLIYKAQDSWFINIQDMKDRLIAENEGINWQPNHLKHGQFLKSMEGAPDWCISRTRYWGTPMPIWIGTDENGKEVDMKVFGSKAEIEAASGMTVTDLHRPFIDDITWKEGNVTYTRLPEVLDVWMDSGSMPYAQMHYPFQNNQEMESSYPADFIVEYIGQVRAWFYVMHVVGVALFDTRSFSNVITTGIVNGSDGRKMSKSYGNYPDPKGTIQKYGADAIRFYMANSPLLTGGNMDFKEEGILEVIKKVILPLWNTYSFFTTYANIDNFSPLNEDIYFIRHGETDNNKYKIVNGGNDDVDINATGIKQAKETAQNIKNAHANFDVIVSSPMLRAQHTAKIIKEEIGYQGDIEIVDGLREMDYGKFKGKKITDIAKEYNLGNDSRKIWAYIVENSGESLSDFRARVNKSIQDIKEKYKGKKVLIVGHAGNYRAIESDIKNLKTTEEYFMPHALKNSSFVKLSSIKSNPLDVWIISETNKLIEDVTGGMESYEVTDATRPIVRFMDNLTNWYIRRSRKRFWKSENDGDKMQAYETLYEVLVTLSKVVAPFMPFVTEEIYKNLTGEESVHLTDFPTADTNLIDAQLNESMDLCQKIINLGLSLRTAQKIRVRQPLQNISIGEHLSEYYKDIIKEELNVKEVIEVDSSSIAQKICKPNGRLIGPKFGKDVKFIISEAKAGNFEEVDENTVKVGDFTLQGDEFEMAFVTEGDSDNIESGFGMVIAMDLEITPELETEGYARDIVRHIQEARKEAGYEVDDRISVNILTDNIEAILASYDIASETLSSIDTSLTNGDIEKEIELGEGSAKIILKK